MRSESNTTFVDRSDITRVHNNLAIFTVDFTYEVRTYFIIYLFNLLLVIFEFRFICLKQYLKLKFCFIQ